MKKLSSLSLFLSVLILISCPVISQEKAGKINLTGTWVGPAETPDGEDIITCVLEHKNGKITGTINDELGFLNDSPVDSAKLTINNLYLVTIVSTPDGDFELILRGTITGNTIDGEWEIPDTGETGAWKAERKKQEKTGLEGTWIGEATIETEDQPNELTVVLTKKEGKLTGVMNDEFGAIDYLPLENIKVDKDNFIFEIVMPSPEGDVTIKFTMKVKGNTMEGELEAVEMGLKGTWEATKTK